jgi:hypothetical protein
MIPTMRTERTVTVRTDIQSLSILGGITRFRSYDSGHVYQNIKFMKFINIGKERKKAKLQ